MRRCSIISVLMVLVSLGLPLKGAGQGFPQGKYKYTPEIPDQRFSVIPNDPGFMQPESVQGTTPDFEKVRDFSKNSAIYHISRKVAYIRAPGEFESSPGVFKRGFWRGSGFLVGRDLLLTNHHCVYRIINEKEELPYEAQTFEQYPLLDTYEVYMEYYEEDNKGSVSAGVRGLVAADAALDYALLRLDRPLGDTYGWLELRETLPKEGSSVRIIQHPRGREKEVVRKHTGIVEVFDDMLHYVADTEGGSSGAPVFAMEGDTVIALHHAGGLGVKGGQYPNEGVLMRAIVPEIRSWLPKKEPKNTSNMVLIPAGKFRMGTDKLAGNAAKPIHSVYLNAFYIDTHEVTVGEYKEFLLDSGHPTSLHTALSEFSPTDDHPIVFVSWHDAMAYAQWAGKRLPTEAEWEKAARGGLMDMRYPWGNDEIDSAKANYGNLQGRTVPVGSYPPNGFGLYDMAGNVTEWCMDPWDSNFYANSPAENPFAGRESRNETIVDYQSVRGLRVVRGGSWSHEAPPTFYVAGRIGYDAKKAPANVGFRCAKDAP